MRPQRATAGSGLAETPACAWCGAPLPGGDRGPGWELVPCPLCGAATTVPVPSEAELERAYGAWYRPRSGRFAGPGDALVRRTRGALARRIDAIAPAGPVLDVGSGDGALVDAIAALGREARGIERAGSVADEHQGVLERPRGADQRGWAAIVFWHSLEHLPAAGRELARAVRLLAPHGVIFVAMPNLDSLQAHAFGRRWLALDLPRHLVHVPARALRTRLHSLGLEVERESHWRGGQVVFGWQHGIVAALPGHPDLYRAIRRPEARAEPLSGPGRAATLAAGGLALPFALCAAGIEVAARRGGSVYVEARLRESGGV